MRFSHSFGIAIWGSIVASPLPAAVYLWTGNVSSDITTAGNWFPVGVPTAGDTIQFGFLALTPQTPTLDTSDSFSCDLLTFTNNLSLTPYTITVDGDFTFAGAGGTVLTTGVLNSSIGTQTFSIANGGSLTFTNSCSAGIATSLNAILYEVGDGATAGTLTFQGSSTAGSALITAQSGSTVSFLNSASGGTATVTLVNATLTTDHALSLGALVANSSSHVAFAGALTVGDTGNQVISGILENNGSAGALVKQGTGTLTLSGANTYTGGTTVTAGTLQGTTTSLQGAISVGVGATVDFDQSTTGTYSGAVSGLGTVGINQEGGTGTVIFSGTDSATLTSVAGGTLRGTTSSLLGNIAVASGAHVDFNQSTTGTFAAVLSGGGDVRINGAGGTGTVILSGINTYTGGTTVSGGTLQGTTTSLVGNIVNNAALLFSQSTLGTYSGNLSGTGSVTVGGSGTVIFSGTNSYAGGTTVSGGTLQGTTSTLQGNILNNSVVTFAQTTSGTYSGVISGTGSVVLKDTGTVTLSGLNTYSGGTSVLAGVLQGTTSSLQGNILDDAAVTFSQAGSGTYSGVISGTGSLLITGGGTVTLSGANSYIGGTSIDSGSTLQGTTTSLHGGIVDSGLLTFSQASTGTYSGAISGGGSLSVEGGGTVILSGTNSYTGGTTLASGTTLQGTTGSLQGDILDNGTLRFEQLGAGTYNGTLSGNGSLEVLGVTTTVFLTGTNTYSGGTLISDRGSVSVSAESNLGDLSGDLTLSLGGTLAAGDDFTMARDIHLGSGGGVVDTTTKTLELSGDIDGAGGLTKSGTGVLELSGSNSYTGGTTISQGTLQATTASLTGDIVDNATLEIAQSGSGTYSGALSGTGALEITGTGTVILSGTNSYGGGTTVSAGILQGTTSSLQGDIVDDAQVVFDQVGSGVYSGVLSGSGQVEVAAGTVTFSGVNLYSGGTLLSGGTLVISQDTNLGQVGVEVSLTGGTLQFSEDLTSDRDLSFTGTGTLDTDGNLVILGGTLEGTGSLVKVGAGTLFLSNTSNTYEGGTLLEGGILRVGSDGALGDAAGDLTFDGGTLEWVGDATSARDVDLQGEGTLNVKSAVTVTLSGEISGAGELVKTGSGTLILGNTGNDYTGGTEISAGVLQGTTQTLVGDILDDAALVFNQAGSGTYGGDITGTGSLSIQGGGTVILSGTNSYSGGTTVAAGSTLQGDTESLQGAFGLSGALVFDQATSGEFGGSMTGSGSLTVEGGGTLHLLGLNSYSGGTTIAGSTTLEGNTGSLQGDIAFGASGTLEFEEAGSGTFGGVLSGASGTLVKSGSGTLTLTGDSSAFLGLTSVQLGRLVLDGQLGGSLVVQSGCTLSGTGSLAENLTIQSGGHFSGSSPTSVFTVSGDYVQNGTLGVEVDGAGQGSLLDVAGTASLGGTLFVNSQDGLYPRNQEILFLSAGGGISGDFTSVQAANPIIVVNLEESPDHTEFFMNFNALYTNIAETHNQFEVATQLDSIDDPTAAQDALLDELIEESTLEAQQTLEQLSGEPYTSVLFGLEIANQRFLRELFNVVRPVLAIDPECLCWDAPYLTWWGQASLGRTFLKEDDGVQGVGFSGYDLVVGLQGVLSPCTVVGTAVAYQMNQVHYDVGGSGREDTGFAALYGIYRPSGGYLLSDLVFGYTSGRVHRSIEVDDLFYHPHGTARVFQSTLYAEIGKDLDTRALLVQPFFGMEVDYLHQHDLEEIGPEAVILSVEERSRVVARSRLGLHMNAVGALGWWNLGVDVAWQHRYTSQDNDLEMAFVDFGGSFLTEGIPLDRNSFDGAVVLSRVFGERWGFFAEFSGQLGEHFATYCGTLGLETSW